MNCSGFDVKSALHIARDCFQNTLFMLYTMFLTICAFPMLKLARERFTLYILVSKIGPTMLVIGTRVLLSTQVLYGFNLLTLARPLVNVLSYFAGFGFVGMRLHMVAMAANRAHAVLFPIHYAQKFTKK
ncbi:hypothetical protein niasHS_009771 [Heterodera schachtii]|uniref:WAT1-related protein n=1 Tax=Heterodera schachtii TaxID=97005 RepID=A0ABD2IXB3_HETSC